MQGKVCHYMLHFTAKHVAGHAAAKSQPKTVSPKQCLLTLSITYQWGILWVIIFRLRPYQERSIVGDSGLWCCRRSVQHRVSAAAAVQSSGGTLLHEYPDFILPFIIQSLAHHPDFPTQEVRHSPYVFKGTLLPGCTAIVSASPSQHDDRQQHGEVLSATCSLSACLLSAACTAHQTYTKHLQHINA